MMTDCQGCGHCDIHGSQDHGRLRPHPARDPSTSLSPQFRYCGAAMDTFQQQTSPPPPRIEVPRRWGSADPPSAPPRQIGTEILQCKVNISQNLRVVKVNMTSVSGEWGGRGGEREGESKGHGDGGDERRRGCCRDNIIYERSTI